MCAFTHTFRANIRTPGTRVKSSEVTHHPNTTALLSIVVLARDTKL